MSTRSESQITQDQRPSPVFFRCWNCGRYISPDERVAERYCSRECAVRYRRCANCGRYFPADEAFAGEYCSRECTVKYSMNRSYGPRELSISAEELV